MTIKMPLFPLNSVLFPNMPFPLHIFEERYKEMVNLCMQEKRPFGIVLIQEGEAEGGALAHPYHVGCTANISNVQKLPEDRLLMMTTGGERFRINRLYHDKPYLQGDVTLWPLADSTNHTHHSTRLHPLVLDYLNILASLGKVDFDTSRIPHEGRDLAYLAASIVQIEAKEKQSLLESDDLVHLLHDLYHIYREEVSLLKLMPQQDSGAIYVN